jgi:hypothetical protein
MSAIFSHLNIFLIVAAIICFVFVQRSLQESTTRGLHCHCTSSASQLHYPEYVKQYLWSLGIGEKDCITH